MPPIEKIWKFVHPVVHIHPQREIVFCRSLGISSKATVPSSGGIPRGLVLKCGLRSEIVFA